jgi:DNA-directed RNA polymerase subunit K/omega
MPKKALSKKIIKEESEDEYEDEDIEQNEDIEEELDEDEEEEESDEEIEEKIIQVDAEGDIISCGIDEAFEDDDDYFNNNEETEVTMETSTEYLNKENRVSCNRMTKYEMVRILGERIKQLNMGAKPLIKNHNGLSYDKIAEEEFKVNMIPFKIKRPLPNGKFEIWTIDELMKEHLYSQLE